MNILHLLYRIWKNSCVVLVMYNRIQSYIIYCGISRHNPEII
jgi:hypothetical protein